MLKELDTRVGHKFLLINRARGELTEATRTRIAAEGLPLLAVLPEDGGVLDHDARGGPAYGISTASPLYQSIDRFLRQLLLNQPNQASVA